MSISDPLLSTNALTAKLNTPGAATPWWITVVYGSQEE
jgi:hypothetical protein